MVDEICRGCGGKLTWIPQYNRYYCHRCKQYPPSCPKCKKDLFWVSTYNRYYCNNCMNYPDLAVSQTPTASVRPYPPPPPPPSLPSTTHAPPPPRKYSSEQIRAIFSQLKKEYEDGSVDEDKHRQLLAVFKFMDEQGRYWTIGAQSGLWYYHDGKQWIQTRASPPEYLDMTDLS